MGRCRAATEGPGRVSGPPLGGEGWSGVAKSWLPATPQSPTVTAPLKGSHPLWPHGLTPPGPKTDGSCVVGALCAPVQLNDSARFHGRTLFAPTAHIRSDVGGGVAGSRSDQCPSGALIRTSGPALLDGGARCAPPSADAPANARALRADMESAPTSTKIWPRRGQSSSLAGFLGAIAPEPCSAPRK